VAIELALTPDSLADIAVAEFISAAGDAGFASVGLAATSATPAVVPLLERAGVRCLDVLALVVGDDRDRTLAAAERVAEAASAVGARWVLAVFRSSERETIAEAAAIISESGARLGVEFSPLGTVPTIPAALELVEAAGPERAGVIIDSWHLLHGPTPWDDLQRVPLDRIAYVQFTDGFGPVSMDETMNHRALPGEGELELERFASTLLDRGWEGIVSVEVLSEELRALPIDEFASRALRTTESFWR
jgi:sugar phosphate isomerase/epimerase